MTYLDYGMVFFLVLVVIVGIGGFIMANKS